MTKSLDEKLARLQADPAGREFIIADAKDADMAFGIAAPGRSPESFAAGEARFRTLPEWMDVIRSIVRQQAVDIMLLSTYICDQLSREGLFADSPVTPACRANDTTDIWAVRHGTYIHQPSRPFRTATIDHIQCGRLDCADDERGEDAPNANLGLYSVTFNNDVELDRIALEQYTAFRLEAERKGFRHFLEIFDPNAPRGFAAGPERAAQIAGFINDHICRTLAGVPDAGRPVFLKMVYHGPRYMEELVRYDPRMIVGVLGGSAGTTRDAFQLIHDAQKHGARVALFGRKINNAENQLAFIRFLRLIVEGQVGPEEAVRAYHGVLQGLKIAPRRPLDEDLQITEQAMSYGGTGGTASVVVDGTKPAAAPPRQAPAPAASAPAAPAAAERQSGPPDFKAMSAQQRLAYHLARLRGGH